MCGRLPVHAFNCQPLPAHAQHWPPLGPAMPTGGRVGPQPCMPNMHGWLRMHACASAWLFMNSYTHPLAACCMACRPLCKCKGPPQATAAQYGSHRLPCKHKGPAAISILICCNPQPHLQCWKQISAHVDMWAPGSPESWGEATVVLLGHNTDRTCRQPLPGAAATQSSAKRCTGTAAGTKVAPVQVRVAQTARTGEPTRAGGLVR